MNLRGKKIGVAITGSFCTFEKAFIQLQKLREAGGELYPIFSENTQVISSRFGAPDAFIAQVECIAGREPILSIEDAEPIGPSGFLDILGE